MSRQCLKCGKMIGQDESWCHYCGEQKYITEFSKILSSGYLNTLELVSHFHLKFGHPIKNSPDLSDEKLCKLRLDLIAEELSELKLALYCNDITATLDALTDLQVVLDGAFLALGFHRFKDAAFLEVHRSNMSKLGADGKPVVRADGKILKGPNYSPPNLKAILKQE